MVAWLVAPAISFISGRLPVGLVEVKVKTWTTTSADAFHRVADNAGENISLLGLASLCPCGMLFLNAMLGISDVVVRLSSSWLQPSVGMFLFFPFFLSFLSFSKKKKQKGKNVFSSNP